jgi:hypothetical protein
MVAFVSLGIIFGFCFCFFLFLFLLATGRGGGARQILLHYALLSYLPWPGQVVLDWESNTFQRLARGARIVDSSMM